MSTRNEKAEPHTETDKVDQSELIEALDDKRMLYEIGVHVSYVVVVAAKSKSEAIEHISTWEHAWDSSSDLIGVSEPEIITIREPRSQHEDDLQDEAHEVV